MSEPLRITSRQNPRVKEVVRLRSGRERRQTGRFVIDGAREIARAIQAGVQCIEAYIADTLADTPECKSSLAAIREASVESFQVTDEVFEKLAFGERGDGIVVVAEQPRRSISELRLQEASLVAVIEGVEKPGNIGAILRSADAAGVDAIIIADGRTDLYNPNTIRASLGTVFRENVCEASSLETIKWLQSIGLQIVAATPDADLPYTQINFVNGAAVVLGSEAQGLSEAWRTKDIRPVHLPMLGMADSLNVSTTAAILFYEALRQRGMKTSQR